MGRGTAVTRPNCQIQDDAPRQAKLFLPARGKGNGRYSAKPLNSRLMNSGELDYFCQDVGRETAVTQPTR
ncbi:MAG: hypothetical protein M5U34_29325 [Chloroflexi bacterium]|nr:hypothetical protein [Chloroflexota bacterium]